MTATSEHLEAFALLTWATPYLTSPNWIACDRQRVTEKSEDTDRFCRDTMRANNGVRYWLELYEKPAPGAKVTKSISLIKYGTGLNGFPGICHGGALLTLMDEAMLHILVANTVLENGLGFMKVGEDYWRLQLHDGKSAQEVLMGRLATATMDVKLLAPVLCPGVVGIETEVLEDSHQDEDESYDEGSTGQAVTQSGRTVGQDSRCSKTITAGSNLVPNVPRESDTLLR